MRYLAAKALGLVIKEFNAVVRRVDYRLAAKLMTKGTMHQRRGNTRASQQERRE
jgi:hypothetical protein